MGLFDLWRRQPFQCVSSLDPETAARRLGEALTPRHRGEEFLALALRGETAFVLAGRVTGPSFEIYAFQPGMRNSFRATLRGQLVPDSGGGCTASGLFAYPLFTRVFMVIWGSVLLAVFGVGLTSAVVFAVRGDTADVTPALVLAAFGAGMLAFGALVASVGMGAGREGQISVRDWLSGALIDS